MSTQSLADLREGAPGMRTPRSKFFHFHAVFGKKIAKKSQFRSWPIPSGKSWILYSKYNDFLHPQILICQCPLTITLQEHQTILTNVTLSEESDLISQWWSMRICRNIWKQESIPVRYALPACQLYMFWSLPLGVSTSGDERWVSQVPWYTPHR